MNSRISHVLSKCYSPAEIWLITNSLTFFDFSAMLLPDMNVLRMHVYFFTEYRSPGPLLKQGEKRAFR